MDKSQIDKLTDPAALKNLMANAKRLDNEEVYWNAFQRLCALEGQDLDDPLSRGFYDMLNAYELLLTEKNGRTTSASRTRQKLKNKGVKQCLIDWALGDPTDGFKLLTQKGLPHLTAEYLVVQHRKEFSEDVVAAAMNKLDTVGVKVGR
jgi:hypothetical protein